MKDSKKSLKESKRRYLKEDYEDTVIKCENFLTDYLGTHFLDNIAIILHSKVPEYNPDWANDEYSRELDSAIDRFITEVMNDLFYNNEDY